MEKITVSLGDFLKNAGIVGLQYLLETSDAEDGKDYGITDDKQGLWLEREFASQADWTEMYFKAFVRRYGALTVYQAALDKIEAILENAERSEWNQSECKEDLKFINEKLLSNSYRSGFETIRHKIDNPEVYELLKTNKLKESMEKETLCERLQQLKQFLEQPLCEETFSMKSIIYNYVNRFWSDKSFLLRTNASKDMKEVFDADFSGPFRKYVSADHEKAKDMCIDCSGKIDTKEKVSIAFMNEQADDLVRKRSAFWNCKVDAYLCPVCAFVYSLMPLGFTLLGKTFVFINMNQDVGMLLKANASGGKLAGDAEREETEKYSSWIARTLDLLLHEKSRELGNIQVIARGTGDKDRYTFNIIAKDVLILLNDKNIKRDLDRLSQNPYIKAGKDFWNVHEDAIMNMLKYRSQYGIINKLLKMTIENDVHLLKAVSVYDIQLRTNLLSKNDKGKTGGELMNRYRVRDEGYKLREALLGEKGAGSDASIRGTIYQLLNALSVGNVEHFMEIIMRVYCSTKLQVPNAFIEFLKDRDTFVEYGYAFLLGLQGSHYEKKEDKINE